MCFREMLISQPTGGPFCRRENKYSPQKLGGESSQALQSRRKKIETSRPCPGAGGRRGRPTPLQRGGGGTCFHPALIISLKTSPRSSRSGPKTPPFLSLLLSVLLLLSFLRSRRAGLDPRLWHSVLRVLSLPDSWWRVEVLNGSQGRARR